MNDSLHAYDYALLIVPTGFEKRGLRMEEASRGEVGLPLLL